MYVRRFRGNILVRFDERKKEGRREIHRKHIHHCIWRIFIMEQNIAKGSSFLKVTGILMIISASISLVIDTSSFFLGAAFDALGAKDVGNFIYLASVIMLIDAAVEMVAGIMGVAFCKKPEKANVCLVMGIIVAVLCVVGTIFSIASGTDFGASTIFSLLLGLVIPVLYIVGAVKNRSVEAPAAE